MKYRTCSHLKRKLLGPLGNNPVLLLLSPGKTPLMTTSSQIPWHVCVWWLLRPWPQPQSIPCEVQPNSWIDFAWQSSSFSSTQLSLNMFGYSTLWTASFCGNYCLWLTLLVNSVNDCLLNNCQISSLPPWFCSLVNQTERPVWRLRKPLQVFWVD